MKYMSKSEDGSNPIQVDDRQVSYFEESGYKVCPAPQAPSVPNEPVVKPKSNPSWVGVRMVKGEQSCLVDTKQVDTMKSAGWKLADKGASSDGHQIDPPERGSEDGSGSKQLEVSKEDSEGSQRRETVKEELKTRSTSKK